jgi:Uma2 family endonuclease
MTAEEFIAWAMEQPETEHYELVAGEVVAQAAERIVHVRTKAAVFLALLDAIRRAGVPCEAFMDGAAVRVDDDTVYEPDALVCCGGPLRDDGLFITDPLVVVEVVSPTSGTRDGGVKVDDYFRIHSVQHYLIVRTNPRAVIHHRRAEAGALHTRILRDGTLRLDPPGLDLTLAALFG